jgi:hypothetical protein
VATSLRTYRGARSFMTESDDHDNHHREALEQRELD